MNKSGIVLFVVFILLLGWIYHTFTSSSTPQGLSVVVPDDMAANYPVGPEEAEAIMRVMSVKCPYVTLFNPEDKKKYQTDWFGPDITCYDLKQGQNVITTQLWDGPTIFGIIVHKPTN